MVELWDLWTIRRGLMNSSRRELAELIKLMREERDIIEQEEDANSPDISSPATPDPITAVHTEYIEAVAERGTWERWIEVTGGLQV